MRPRRKNPEYPRYFHHQHGAFYLTQGGKWIPLGREMVAALALYRKLIGKPDEGAMATLITDALNGHKAKVSAVTMKQYRLAGAKLAHMLSQFRVEEVRSKDIVKVRRQLEHHPNMANRVLTVAHMAFDRAVEDQVIDSNPVVGVKRCEETSRDRLITPDEFDAIREKAVPRLQCAMDLMFLTGQRVNDVLSIGLADLRDEGIYFRQDKTEAKLLVAWTTELRAAVGRAKALIRGGNGLTLLQGRHGKPVDYRSIRESWETACRKAGVEDAQMRDIRAMAATATRAQGGDATALLGHKSKAMTDRYLRDKIVPVVSGPSRVLPIKRKDVA